MVTSGTLMKAVCISEHGDYDVLKLVDIPVPVPGPGQVRIKVFYSALNQQPTEGTACWSSKGFNGNSL